MSGLLINGTLHEVPGLNIISPGQEPWARMDPGDYAPRSSATPWIRQITIHTTKGDGPITVRPGKGPGGKAASTAKYWSTNAEHGGAGLVVDDNGDVACLIDLYKYGAYHATTVNPWSVGIEMYQESDNSIYQATLDSTVLLVKALCDLFGIPFQGDNRSYHENGILKRMLYGGKDVVGVYGHRDNAWDFAHNTSSRGRYDPGDEIWVLLKKAGLRTFNVDGSEEIGFWKGMQAALNKKYGLSLTVDGQCGPGTVAALRKYGLWNGGAFADISAV